MSSSFELPISSLSMFGIAFVFHQLPPARRASKANTNDAELMG